MANKLKLDKELTKALLSKRLPLGDDAPWSLWDALEQKRDHLVKLVKILNEERRTNPLFEIVARHEADRLGYKGGNPYLEVDEMGHLWLSNLAGDSAPAEETAPKKAPKQIAVPKPKVERKKGKRGPQDIPTMAWLRDEAKRMGVEIPDELGTKRSAIRDYLAGFSDEAKIMAEAAPPVKPEEPITKPAEEIKPELVSDGEDLAALVDSLVDTAEPKPKGMFKTAPAVTPLEVIHDDEFSFDAEPATADEILDDLTPVEVPATPTGIFQDLDAEASDVDLDKLPETVSSEDSDDSDDAWDIVQTTDESSDGTDTAEDDIFPPDDDFKF